MACLCNAFQYHHLTNSCYSFSNWRILNPVLTDNDDWDQDTDIELIDSQEIDGYSWTGREEKRDMEKQQFIFGEYSKI